MCVISFSFFFCLELHKWIKIVDLFCCCCCFFSSLQFSLSSAAFQVLIWNLKYSFAYVFLALASTFSCLLFTIYNAQCKLSHIFYIFSFSFPFSNLYLSFPCTFRIIHIHIHFVCVCFFCFWLKFYFYSFKYFFEANLCMLLLLLVVCLISFVLFLFYLSCTTSFER